MAGHVLCSDGGLRLFYHAAAAPATVFWARFFALPPNRAILTREARRVEREAVYAWKVFAREAQMCVRLIRSWPVAMSSEATSEAWVEDWAGRIRALGFAPGALLLIEMARAFGTLGSHAVLLAQPLVGGLVTEVTMDRLTALLEEQDLLDRLEVNLRGEAP